MNEQIQTQDPIYVNPSRIVFTGLVKFMQRHLRFRLTISARSQQQSNPNSKKFLRHTPNPTEGTMIVDSNNSKNFDDKTPLPPSFEPGPYDVICKRGKSAKDHEGNQRYRTLIQSALDQYSKADSKMKKSVIVSEIVDFVRSKSPNGGFVKQDEEIGDRVRNRRFCS